MLQKKTIFFERYFSKFFGKYIISMRTVSLKKGE
jgi:hypothetical protein